MNRGLQLVLSIAFILLVHPCLGESVRVEGFVHDPDGKPVEAARVTARTICGGTVYDEVDRGETDYKGRFALQVVPEQCGRVMLRASKYEDYWLDSGTWDGAVEDAGTAPVVDLSAGRPDPIVVTLGNRGGELSIEVTDEKNSFWPSVVFVNHCTSKGSARASGHSPITAESPVLTRLLPAGRYCVGVASANGMFPEKSTCTVVEVVSGQSSQIKLMVDPVTLTTEFVAPERGCPSQAGAKN